MRKAFWPVIAGIALVGCGDVSSPKAETPAPIVAAPTKIESVDFESQSELRLFRGIRTLSVGDPWESAQNVFPSPKRFYPLDEVPSKITGPLKAQGWMTDNEGFGVLLFNGRVAMAMHQIEKATPEMETRVLNEYQSYLSTSGALEVKGSRSHYWFRDDKTHRLMICSVMGADGYRYIAVAVGDRNLMDALRMSPSMAKEDQRLADAIPILPADKKNP